jgi:hypothetical protein
MSSEIRSTDPLSIKFEKCLRSVIVVLPFLTQPQQDCATLTKAVFGTTGQGEAFSESFDQQFATGAKFLETKTKQKSFNEIELKTKLRDSLLFLKPILIT